MDDISYQNIIRNKNFLKIKKKKPNKVKPYR